MGKIHCPNCNYKNKYNMKQTVIYCNSCGKKININEDYKKEKNNIRIVIAIVCIIIFIIFFLIIHVRPKNKMLNTSDIIKYCDNIKECNLNLAIKDNLMSLFKYKIKEDVIFTDINDKYTVKLEQFGREKEFEFTIKDDLAPELNNKRCILNYKEKLDFNKCFIIYDYIDGKIDVNNKNVIIDSSNININEEGTYVATIEVIDSLGNILNEEINIEIAKVSPNKIILDLPDTIKINEPVELKATIEPSNVTDKSIDWSYKESTSNTYINLLIEEFKSEKEGIFNICAKSRIDEKLVKCKDINVTK